MLDEEQLSGLNSAVVDDLIIRYSAVYAMYLAMKNRGLEKEATVYQDLVSHFEDIANDYDFQSDLEEQKKLVESKTEMIQKETAGVPN